MKCKPILFALIAAAVSGIAGDMTEKGLIAWDEKRQQRKKEEAEGNATETDEAEDESLE